MKFIKKLAKTQKVDENAKVGENVKVDENVKSGDLASFVLQSGASALSQKSKNKTKLRNKY